MPPRAHDGHRSGCQVPLTAKASDLSLRFARPYHGVSFFSCLFGFVAFLCCTEVRVSEKWRYATTSPWRSSQRLPGAPGGQNF